MALFRGAHDRLEREFKVFNWLEASVCTMCALGDQRRSRRSQFEDELAAFVAHAYLGSEPVQFN
ncbi:hypothetical protein BRAS3843_1490006 [Bradyrhizobium sp. STM 3843]|nr:hypothetical protein BRAS3843_1490006 [Bradyrhizobium sp. STM 3843]